MRKRLAALVLAPLAWFAAVAGLILHEQPAPTRSRADVAIILGAAVLPDGTPSPVLEGRLEHGLALYRSGQVKRLLLTGGRGEGQPRSEALAAATWAYDRGVRPEAMILEQRSRTTMQNLVNAGPLMEKEGLRTALLVSDPLHLPRAMRMARKAGIDAVPSPTPTTRYRSWRTRIPFLLRESFFLTGHWLTGR